MRSESLKIKLFSKCACYKEGYDCGGFDYIIFKSKWFQFRWFNDNGYRFIYIHLGKKVWRFDY
jgi:hypothetical protein